MSFKTSTDRLGQIRSLTRKRERELRLADQYQYEDAEWKQIRIRLAQLNLKHAIDLLQNQ